jgi:hypothetical protein
MRAAAYYRGVCAGETVCVSERHYFVLKDDLNVKLPASDYAEINYVEMVSVESYDRLRETLIGLRSCKNDECKLCFDCLLDIERALAYK